MAGSHAGVKFDDLLDCVDGATPIELLQRQVYAEVAVPLKEGIYRPASLLLLARAVGDQTRASALRQLTFSSSFGGGTAQSNFGGGQCESDEPEQI